MDERRKEYAALIKATLHYLQDEWSEHVHLTLKESPPPFLPPTPIVKKKMPPVEKKPLPKPASNWELHPMPLPAETPPQFSSFFKSIPLPIPIRLFVTESSQTLFLEGVARAVTQEMAPAALFSGRIDTLLTNQTINLILAPLSYLKKRFPQAELHEFLKVEKTTLLPLADTYDLAMKRTLWNRLKSFRNMPPSS